MITGRQSRAARKLLGWSYATLAKQARQPLNRVGRVEDLNGDLPADLVTTACGLQATLEAAGVEFGYDGSSVGFRRG
jgi:hypothetical protein